MTTTAGQSTRKLSRSEIVQRLRSLAAPHMDRSLAFTPLLMSEAADEIERLVRQLEALRTTGTDQAQYDRGYAEAQRDIRAALGIEND